MVLVMGIVREWKGAQVISVPLCSEKHLCFSNCVFREAALASLLKGEILRQIFAFSRMVDLGVSEKSQIKLSLAIFFELFLFALELCSFHIVPLASERLFLADGRVDKQ